jgi:hypothetical protein
MPTADFGQEVKIGSSNLFVSLKKKDETIKFRILAAPYYDGMHFIKKGDKEWDRIACTRVNEGSPCGYCEQYFDILNGVKNKEDKKAMDEAHKLADPYKATVTFYYPIINRDTQEFQIFKTRKSVRDEIEVKAKNGTKVLERDFIVTRTERPGAGYYSVDTVDSSDSIPLTALELEAREKFKEKSLESYIYGSKDENSAVAVEESNTVPGASESIEASKAKIRETLNKPEYTVNVEDLPF